MGLGQKGGYVYNAVRHHRSTALAKGISLRKTQKRKTQNKNSKSRKNRKGGKNKKSRKNRKGGKNRKSRKN